jgi:hypothetical protein
MNCDQALVSIVEADLATLHREDTPIGRHVHACERCAAVVRMLQRETAALTSLVATVPLAMPAGAPARARARRPQTLRWISLAAVSGVLMYVVLLRASADTRVPMVAQRPSAPHDAAPPSPASSAPASVALVTNPAVATRSPRQGALPPRPLRTVPPDAVPIPLGRPIVAERTVSEPTVAVAVPIANDAVPADSSLAPERDVIARHAIALPQSNPRVTVLWLSPSPPRPLP